MKKLLVAVAALGLVATANAGDYHKKETLRCSQCHTMHASRAHGFNNGTFTGSDLNSALPDQGNAHRKLLVLDGTNDTCLSCHDLKTNVPDVFGASSQTGMNGLRSAGALNGATTAHTQTTHQDWMGHTLGSGVNPPGYVGLYTPTPLEGFNCANCHAVHGSDAYRNLGLNSLMGLEGMANDATNPFTNVGPTYNALPTTGNRNTTFNPANDVTIIATGRSYKTAEVQFGNAAGTSGMNAYCAVCHGNFHGDANTKDQVGGVDFVRHPTSGIYRNNAGGTLLNGIVGTDFVRPAWITAPGATANFEAACLSCHKGHGNARGYGLLYPAINGVNGANLEEGGAAVESDGTYPIRNLCTTCHAQGR